MKQIKVDKTCQIDGRKIYVFDNLLPEKNINGIYEALNIAPFTHNEIARPDVENYKHWVYNVPLNQAKEFPLILKVNQVIQTYYQNKYRIYRCYCNMASFGDMLFPHTDCLPEANELTALWFIQDEWNYEWGGETLFYNKDKDAEFVVSPKPGRLVIFDGAIEHAGNAPHKICTKPRYTFALKFEKY